MEVPPDELQLGQLLVGLKYRPLCEQFSQNAPVTQETQAEKKLNRLPEPEPTRQGCPSGTVPAAPHVDGRRVPLFAQKQLWWAVPQRDDFIGVRST